MSPATAAVYVRLAFSQTLQVADRMGDELINVRPPGPDTNAVAALIIHCCAVAEYWLGHVALGRPSTRHRDSEFSRTATLAELHDLVDDALLKTITDIERLDAGEGRDDGGRQFLEAGDGSDAAVVLHVLEELFQHLGHMELTADALGAS
jgi:DinB superfamily